MEMLLQLPTGVQIAIMLFTIIGLWWGSERVIDGAGDIARRLKVSEMLIALSIVSIGSSLPEIFVNIKAGLSGADDIGVGNVVGSCFAQISYILGICVLVAGNMTEDRKRLKRDGALVLGSILLVWLFGLDGVIASWEAIILMGIYVSYLSIMFLNAKHHEEPVFNDHSHPFYWSLILVFGGIFVVWISSEILLTIGINMGRNMGLNEGFIGLMTGVGTSVPELAISLIALLHHRTELSVGNLLGSNITDPLLSMPLGALVGGGFAVSDYLVWRAIPLWFGVTFIVLFLFYKFHSINRKMALGLVAYYLISFWFLA